MANVGYTFIFYYCLLLLYQVQAIIVDCGFFLDLSVGVTGTISSPNYPNEYPDSARCIWRFQAPAGYHVNLTSNVVNLERRGGECRDLVQFRNGSRDEAVLAEYCDMDFTVTSPSRWLWVMFQSDSQINNTGFEATYSVMKATRDITVLRSPLQYCRSYEYSCANRECVPFSYRCDGGNDCGCLTACDEDGCISTALDRGGIIGIGISAGIVFFLLLFCFVTFLDRKHHNVFFKKINDKKIESRRESRASLHSRRTQRENSTISMASRTNTVLGWGSRNNSTLGEWSLRGLSRSGQIKDANIVPEKINPYQA